MVTKQSSLTFYLCNDVLRWLEIIIIKNFHWNGFRICTLESVLLLLLLFCRQLSIVELLGVQLSIIVGVAAFCCSQEKC
jgi:hypothetical protein